ncbi:DUF1178 family protein [Denitrobaculum tricleocarpae]|uniref:DUF1178 family protein n=1 Tax=Denitrobaculum tricleocarpae TaxID=2591009 RepID=A0A545T7P1_9PROT|nr:DUF1178 family protein [Denitrobaculum tricleocarpae]TQV73231.1 DUF1178 family protein [Denitrobaculum tricleocarpae]
MIVFDLRCKKEHVFEAWFKDSAAYHEQVEAGVVRCPVCGSSRVEKALMAPNVATRRQNKEPAQAESDQSSAQMGEVIAPAASPANSLQAQGSVTTNADLEKVTEVMRALTELRENVERECDYVGDDFAEEARKIHYGEREPRGIYGESSDEDAKALEEEGVEFARVPWVPRHDS